MSRRRKIKLVPLGNPEQFQDILYSDESITLGELLSQAPALSTEPIDESLMEQEIGKFVIMAVEEPWDCPLYRPPGLVISDQTQEDSSAPDSQPSATESQPAAPTQQKPDNQADHLSTPGDHTLPTHVKEKDAVILAYAREIDTAASFLRAELSVLIVCEKLVVANLWQEMARRANLKPVELSVPEEDESGLMARSLRQRQLATLKHLINALKQGDVLVIPHLDLLAGGSDANLPTESRELIELVYKQSDRLILAFADRSQDIPEVLAARFAVRLLISGVSRTVVYPNGEEKSIGRALVTADEAAHFQDFDPEGLYKNVRSEA
ncbi:hypothetical protein, partial [Moorena sp. SIO3H5]|uniref:hypothetical protein n=1 Tax=Moorena sp. SIO3H5 TaxID=2607834 RepID=UPI0013B8FF4D